MGSLFPRRYEPAPARTRPRAVWIWERRRWSLRCVLDAAGVTIHDVVNDARVREAVRLQWQLAKRCEEDRAIRDTIAYLEAQNPV